MGLRVALRLGPAALEGDLPGDDLPGALEGDCRRGPLIAEGDLFLSGQGLTIALADGEHTFHLPQQEQVKALLSAAAADGKLGVLPQTLDQLLGQRALILVIDRQTELLPAPGLNGGGGHAAQQGHRQQGRQAPQTAGHGGELDTGQAGQSGGEGEQGGNGCGLFGLAAPESRAALPRLFRWSRTTARSSPAPPMARMGQSRPNSSAGGRP